MPIDFSVGECLALVLLGRFLSARAGGKIQAGVTDTVVVRLPVPGGCKIVTERFNFGGTSIGVEKPKVKYEIHYEEGLYCWNYISQANLENVCTHIYSADFVEVYFYNISDPPEDVYYDFCVWYYTYQALHHDRVMAILLKTPDTLQAILEVLKGLRVPPVEVEKLEEKLNTALSDLSAIRKKLCI